MEYQVLHRMFWNETFEAERHSGGEIFKCLSWIWARRIKFCGRINIQYDNTPCLNSQLIYNFMLLHWSYEVICTILDLQYSFVFSVVCAGKLQSIYENNCHCHSVLTVPNPVWLLTFVNKCIPFLLLGLAWLIGF